jgi:hypothetical protein
MKFIPCLSNDFNVSIIVGKISFDGSLVEGLQLYDVTRSSMPCFCQQTAPVKDVVGFRKDGINEQVSSHPFH